MEVPRTVWLGHAPPQNLDYISLSRLSGRWMGKASSTSSMMRKRQPMPNTPPARPLRLFASSSWLDPSKRLGRVTWIKQRNRTDTTLAKTAKRGLPTAMSRGVAAWAAWAASSMQSAPLTRCHTLLDANIDDVHYTFMLLECTEAQQDLG